MSRYSGRQGKGARRKVKALKREQAEIRNELYQESKNEKDVSAE